MVGGRCHRCVFEVVHALEAQRPIVIKLGRAVKVGRGSVQRVGGDATGSAASGGDSGSSDGSSSNSRSDDGNNGGGGDASSSGASGNAISGSSGARERRPWAWQREWAHGQVRALAASVDVLRSGATKREDYDRIGKVAALFCSFYRIQEITYVVRVLHFS